MSGAEARFSGFGPATFKFLRGLAKNNSKAWFEEHRADYEAYYVEPAKAFVVALAPRLKKVSKTLSVEPRINGSIFRINRDVRFSKDKTPYKSNLSLRFWDGERRGGESLGLFFRLTPAGLFVGAGIHKLEKAQLDAYRKAVLDPRKGRALVKVPAVLEAEGFSIGEATRKKVPRGFDAEHERAGLLLHDSLVVLWKGRVPVEANSAKLVAFCAGKYEKFAPLHRWLMKVV